METPDLLDTGSGGRPRDQGNHRKDLSRKYPVGHVVGVVDHLISIAMTWPTQGKPKRPELKEAFRHTVPNPAESGSQARMKLAEAGQGQGSRAQNWEKILQGLSS